MYFLDHAPPHFHVRYNDHEAQIRIDDLIVIEGDLPKRALALALEWALMHQDELARNWDLCAKGRAPRPIEPLED